METPKALALSQEMIGYREPTMHFLLSQWLVAPIVAEDPGTAGNTSFIFATESK